LSSIQKFLSLLDPADRKRAALMTVLITLMAGLEMLGVASIFPFLNVLGDPGSVETNEWLAWSYQLSGAESLQSFMAFLAAAAFVLIALSSGARIFTQYAINQFVQHQRHVIGVRLLDTYLHQPYAFFLNRHGSDIGRSILSEADVVVTQFIKPLMDLLAHAALIIVLIVLLVVVNPTVALAAVAIIGGFYGIVYAIVRRKLAMLSTKRIQANRRRFRISSDAVDSIKLIKLHGLERDFVDQFDQPSSDMARSVALSATLAKVPRYVIETVAIGGVLLVFLGLILTTDGDSSAAVGSTLPILGLYAFAGYRILPSAQAFYSAITYMRLGRSALDEVHADLAEKNGRVEEDDTAPMPFQRTIGLKGLRFQYEGADLPALDGVTLEIRAGEALGIRGETGAGKSTLVDILLGLLEPTAGRLVVDDQPVTRANRRAWQKNLAYVPQDIVLADTSIRDNIAFEHGDRAPDRDRVEHAARLALIHDFVDNELPQGYDTLIGERGVRLSGGQRQRLGIARALYRKPKALVLDEATSALDEQTEQNLIENLESLHTELTLIIVSHRPAALQHCDRIVEVHDGEVREVEAA